MPKPFWSLGHCFLHLLPFLKDKGTFCELSAQMPPGSYTEFTPEEALSVIGGADETSGFSAFLDNVSKFSKVLNYMARIFSSTSSMLNNFITAYNTLQQLNRYISKNF